MPQIDHELLNGSRPASEYRFTRVRFATSPSPLAPIVVLPKLSVWQAGTAWHTFNRPPVRTFPLRD
jgi:hypothetical protein